MKTFSPLLYKIELKHFPHLSIRWNNNISLNPLQDKMKMKAFPHFFKWKEDLQLNKGFILLVFGYMFIKPLLWVCERLIYQIRSEEGVFQRFFLKALVKAALFWECCKPSNTSAFNVLHAAVGRKWYTESSSGK